MERLSGAAPAECPRSLRQADPVTRAPLTMLIEQTVFSAYGVVEANFDVLHLRAFECGIHHLANPKRPAHVALQIETPLEGYSEGVRVCRRVGKTKNLLRVQYPVSV